MFSSLQAVCVGCIWFLSICIFFLYLFSQYISLCHSSVCCVVCSCVLWIFTWIKMIDWLKTMPSVAGCEWLGLHLTVTQSWMPAMTCNVKRKPNSTLTGPNVTWSGLRAKSNLIVSSLVQLHVPPFRRILWKSVENRFCIILQTNK